LPEPRKETLVTVDLSYPADSEATGAEHGLPLIYHSTGYGPGEFVGITRDEVERWLLRNCGSVNIRPYVDRVLSWYDLDPSHPYHPERNAAGWDGYLHCFWRVRVEPIRDLRAGRPAE
jgi:hypothetical protein